MSEAVYRAGSWIHAEAAPELLRNLFGHDLRPGFGAEIIRGPGSGRTSSTSNLTDTVLEANPGPKSDLELFFHGLLPRSNGVLSCLGEVRDRAERATAPGSLLLVASSTNGAKID